MNKQLNLSESDIVLAIKAFVEAADPEFRQCDVHLEHHKADNDPRGPTGPSVTATVTAAKPDKKRFARSE